MYVKLKKTNIFIVMLILLFSIVMVFIFLNLEKVLLEKSVEPEKLESRALFSWKSEEVNSDNTEIFEIMEKQRLNTLYQEFSRSLSQDEINEFLTDAKKNKIDVYYLAGNPEWALDETGMPMIDSINRVVELNNNLDGNIKLKGIVFDIEPYSLDEWKNEEKVMNDFVKGMEIAYQNARVQGIEIILCIPYFYDNKDLTIYLEELIKSGCDSVAIMNYSRDSEIKNMKLEVELATKYNKNIINIYELQPPGTRGLTEKNTYYNQGIEAIEKNFLNIQEEFYGKDISIAFHEYNSLKEVLGFE